ncbi:MAG: hypothetical protein PHH08_00865 [Candidatus ainarchaeum sp.]|nr:hypothetical protein [Candidatus ainarchaeum sp.]
MKEALHEFREKKLFLLFVLLEFLLAVCAVVSFFAIMGFNVFRIFNTRQITFFLNLNFLDTTVFALSIVFFAIIFFAVKKRFPKLYKAQEKAFFEIKLSAREKVSKSKSDPRAIALLVIEFLFVAVVFVSLSAFFDPEFELIPWSSAGIFPPTTTILNLGIAFLVLAGFYWLYTQTADYRQGKQPLQKKRK